METALPFTFWNGSPAIPLQRGTALNPEVITLNPLKSSYFSYPLYQILKFICEKWPSLFCRKF